MCILSKPVVFAQKPNGNSGSTRNKHDYESDQETPDLRTMVFLALTREPRFAVTVSNDPKSKDRQMKLTFQSFHALVVGLVLRPDEWPRRNGARIRGL